LVLNGQATLRLRLSTRYCIVRKAVTIERDGSKHRQMSYARTFPSEVVVWLGNRGHCRMKD
jgi:hypothetical protein